MDDRTGLAVLPNLERLDPMLTLPVFHRVFTEITPPRLILLRSPPS